MDVLAWSAWTGNAIALASIGYTWWTGRGTKQAAAAASERADESLHTAQEAAAAQQRMADVLEKMFEAQERHTTGALRSQAIASGAAPSASASAPPWLVERTGAGRYQLTNAGPATVYDVHVAAVSGVVRLDPPLPEGDSWVAGTSRPFDVVASWQTGTPQIVVTWRDAPDGAQRRWERVIPQ